MTMTPVERTPRYRLGRKPNSGKPRVRLTAGNAPSAAYNPPPTVDWYSHVLAASWGMDGNDNVGDCTCADVDHEVKAMQVAAGNPEVNSTDTECLQAYSAITGWDPSDPNTDQGAEMQDVRNYWRKQGFTLGGKPDKIALFAEVDHTNVPLTRWCVQQFGGAVGLGINFPDSAMQQFNQGKPWDVVKGSSIEGGHAIALVGYDAQFWYVVTWGQVQKVTPAFFSAYVEEAWLALSADFVNSATGEDPLAGTLYDLGAQFAAITKQPNPFPAPSPTPTPTPTPTPSPLPPPTPDPGAAPFPGATVGVSQRVDHAAARAQLSTTDWLNRHFDKYFDLIGP